MRHPRLSRLSSLVVVALIVACGDPTTPSDQPSVRMAKATGSTIVVKTTSPSSAPQNITLDVVISGSGFEPGSSAKWLLNGLEDPRVITNSTTVISSTSINANITISADAVPSLYDVAVVTPLGKKGIGTEKFTVLAMEQLSAEATARDVNSSGIVVGSMSGGCDGYGRPVVWISKQPQVLPLPGDFCLGRALHINDAGVIVGYVNKSGAVSHTTDAIIMWTPVAGGYGTQILDLAPDGTNPWDAGDLNESGNAVVNHCCAAPRAYWWSEATGYVRLMDVPGTAGCYASDVNDRDEIIGWCRTTPASSSELNESAAYWSSPYAVPELLPRLGTYGYVHTAKALNNRGAAVGEAWNRTRSGQLRIAGVIWTRTSSGWAIATIPDFGGGDTKPAEINDDGWVTGSARLTTGKFRAFLWQTGQVMRDLGAIGPESNAFGMNSAASVELLIAGTSESGNVNRAVLWKPSL